MRKTYTIGKKDGEKVTAIYTRSSQSSLPTLVIRWGNESREFTGSSLGPTNALYTPTADDLRYWQSLVGIQSDAAIERSLAAHRAVEKRQELPSDY